MFDCVCSQGKPDFETMIMTFEKRRGSVMGRGFMRRIGIAGMAVLGALSVVSVALAGGDASTSGYSNIAGLVQKKVSAPTTHTTHVTGTLPFTGANLALFALAAVVLVALGIGLRRVSSRA